MNTYAHAECLWIEAIILRETGHIEKALANITTAIGMAHDEQIAVPEAFFEIERGRILLAGGEPEAALTALQQAAAMHRRLGDRSREADALDAAGSAYQILMRFDDAVQAHQCAAAHHGDLADPWHQALALTNLASALYGLDARDEAAQHRMLALQLITGYGDPRAIALRSKLTNMAKTVRRGRSQTRHRAEPPGE